MVEIIQRKKPTQEAGFLIIYFESLAFLTLAS